MQWPNLKCVTRANENGGTLAAVLVLGVRVLLDEGLPAAAKRGEAGKTGQNGAEEHER